MKDVLANLTDSYSRVARLYPAVLGFLPFFWTALALDPKALAFDASHLVGVGLVASAVVAFLTSVARSRGKVVEKQLLDSWGTWMTTIILRHRNGTLDPVTKGRYHARLQTLCTDLVLPTTLEEAQDAPGADAKYRAATTRLIERRRDAKYKMLHKENAQYGFRRNLLGLKPLALTVALLAAAVTLAVEVFGFTQTSHSFGTLFADATVRWPVYASFLADVGYALFFALIVRPHFVRQAAEEYALALFRTLDRDDAE